MKQRKRIETLHRQLSEKDMRSWMREMQGRFNCRVFMSPAKPKLQSKENFLLNHMQQRAEPVSFNSDGSVLKAD